MKEFTTYLDKAPKIRVVSKKMGVCQNCQKMGCLKQYNSKSKNDPPWSFF
jgi:hypothetical protein